MSLEIYVYDTEMVLKGVIDELTSLLWTRRYWSVGDFKLLVPFTSANARLLIKDQILMKRGDREAAQISYVTIKKNPYGLEEIEVQGKFITSWLNRRIILNQIITTDTSQNILNRIVSENMGDSANDIRKIPLFSLKSESNNIGGTLFKYVSQPYSSCLLETETIAKAASLGFRIETDQKTKQHHFCVYSGRELTADQKLNPPCIFSQAFDNVFEQEYTNSVENLKNTCYIGGEENEGISRQIVELGTSKGLNRREVFLNASSLKKTYKEGNTEKTMTSNEYIAALKDRGLTELAQYVENLNFSSKINAFSNLVYKQDFDIGDLVTCIDKRWGIKINARITEITESYQQNKNEIDVTFGESLPSLLEKMSHL